MRSHICTTHARALSGPCAGSSLASLADSDLDVVEAHLEEQSEAFAREKRTALASRAEALLEELESSAPPSFRKRNEVDVPPQKSPSLPRGASIVI